MSFRTLEITNPTEIHIKNNQLELTQENRQIYIPIEDLSMITTIGSNIRLSTMDLSILANNHVSLTAAWLPATTWWPSTPRVSNQRHLVERPSKFGGSFNCIREMTGAPEKAEIHRHNDSKASSSEPAGRAVFTSSPAALPKYPWAFFFFCISAARARQRPRSTTAS